MIKSQHQIFKNTKGQRPLAVVHIDVDSISTIAEHFTDENTTLDHSIYTKAIPNFLELLNAQNLSATFFCIGKDAKYDEPTTVMQKIISQGHEIANHTMNHKLNFDQLSISDKKREIIECDTILKEVTQSKIIGFRSPGYFNDDYINETLTELGYSYDTSKLPTPILQFMKTALRLLSGNFKTNKRFGKLRDSWGKQKPYNVTNNLIEIPISVTPLIRFPFHSTMIFLIGKWFFNLGMKLTQKFNLPLVYLFHAVDLLPDTDNIAAKKHLPLRINFDKRHKIVEYILKTIKQNFEVVTTSGFVSHFIKSF